MKKIIYILLLFLPTIFLYGQSTYTIGSDGDYATWAAFNTAVDPSPGDEILFKRGETFREDCDIDFSGTEANPIRIGSYGTGANPKIYGSTSLTNWTVDAGNRYVSATSVSTPTSGGYEGGLYSILDDSVYHWNERQGSVGAVDSDGEWCYSSGAIYFYWSAGDPDTEFDSFEVGQRGFCFSMDGNNPEEWLIFDSLTVRFSVQAGISSGYPGIGGVEGMIFRHDTIGYIGIKGSGMAYGIEDYHANSLIENCFFSDCGRRAISYNTYITQNTGEEIHIQNLIIRRNTFLRGYHTTSLDASVQLSNTDAISDVYFYNNIIDETDLTSYPDNTTSNQIFFQAGGASTHIGNIYIVGNVFVGASARNILIEGSGGGDYFIWNNSILGHNLDLNSNPWWSLNATGIGDMSYINNLYYDPTPADWGNMNYGIGLENNDGSDFSTRDYNLYYQESTAVNGFTGGWFGFYDIDNWTTYQSENSPWDANSPTPADPLFTDFSGRDYTIGTNSPAYKAGTPLSPVNVTDPFGHTENITSKDILGNAMNNPPDLGAIQASEVTTAISELHIGRLILAPNPAGYTFTIKIPPDFSEDNFEIKIYSIDGKLVYDIKELYGRQVLVNIPGRIGNGLYIVQAYNKSKVLLEKLIISK